MNIIILRLIHYILAIGSFVRQWIFRISSLSFNKTDGLKVQADGRKLKKLPLHLGMIIIEEDISYTDIANFVLWSAAMGISFISIYDSSGEITYLIYLSFCNVKPCMFYLLFGATIPVCIRPAAMSIIFVLQPP